MAMRYLLAIILGVGSLVGVAQSWSLDPDFNAGESWSTGHGPSDGNVRSLIPYADGRLLIAGTFHSYNHQACIGLARLLPSGELDTTFNTGLEAQGVSCAAILPDGHIIAVGSFTSWGDYAYRDVVRLNEDGHLDTTFQAGSGFQGIGPGNYHDVKSITVQPDGRLLMAGWFTGYNGVPANHMVRLMPDGAVDPSFTADLEVSQVNALSLLSDGRMLVAGSIGAGSSITSAELRLLLGNGAVDTTFGFALNSTFDCRAIHPLPDGRQLVGGAMIYPIEPVGRLLIIDTNGNIDPILFTNSELECGVTALHVDPLGRIIVGMSRRNTHQGDQPLVVRLHADGSADQAFSPAVVKASYSFVNEARVQALCSGVNGTIWVGGTFTAVADKGCISLARLTENGMFDNTFNPSISASHSLNQVILDPLGRVHIRGSHLSYQNHNAPKLSRIHTDGSVDTSFKDLLLDGSPYSMALQPDGKLVIGGWFTSARGQTHNGIIRLNADGTLDSTFTTEGAEFVTAVAVYPDGRILVAGQFDYFGGQPANHIVRLMPDGSNDPSFQSSGPGPWSQSYISRIIIDQNSRAIIMGDFSTFNGTAVTKIVRLDPDDTVDFSFAPSFGWGGWIIPLSDGRYLNCKGLATCQCKLLNEDGSYDNSFNTGVGANGAVTDAILLEDGRYLICGWFSAYSGAAVNCLAVLASTGELDPTVDLGVGPGNPYVPTYFGNTTPYLQDMQVLPDGDVAVCGNFTTFNLKSARYMVRLKRDLSLEDNIRQDEQTVEAHPNPTTSYFLMDIPGPASITVNDVQGRLVLQQHISGRGLQRATIDLGDREAGIYVVHVSSGTQQRTARVMKQ